MTRGRKGKWYIVKEAIDDGRIEKWLAGGQFEKTICKNLGINVATWERYKNEHSELREVIKKGNVSIVAKVEDALIKRALGYDYEESKTIIKIDAKGNEYEQTEIHKKHAMPDVGAACFVLKNKAPNDWKNDPKLAELRERELELRKMIAEGKGEIWEP